jgi:drug/metabolite transporter (DMT)-like permease
VSVASDASSSNVLKGISAVLLGVFIFSSVDAIAKWLGGLGFHPTQIVMMRYCFGVVPVAIALWLSRDVVLKARNPLLQVVRGLLMCGALLQFFWGLKYIPLAEAMAVAFTAPLFITALSVPVLRETVGPHRWAAVAVGFLGMLVILRPGFSTFQPEALLIVSSALTFAFGVVITRLLTATESNTTIFAYTTFIAVLAMTPFGLSTWQAPELLHWGMFAVIGLFGGLAHYLVIVAYRHAPAAVNSPFEYTGLIWGSLLGWVIWREAPDMWVWIGAAVIVTAGVYITYREAVAGAKSVDAPDPLPQG